MEQATSEPHSHTPDVETSDPELIKATRDGDTGAYAQLYERHYIAANRLARILTSDAATADDLVSETFAKILQAMQEGKGPDLSFRPYLLRSMRNVFYDRLRKDKKVTFTDDAAVLESGETQDDATVAKMDRRYASNAFSKLPERWQMVLWHTEVENDSPASIAPLLGMTANGVAALAYRARERLRQLFLQEHIADSPDAQCHWTVERLGAHVRGRLATRESQKVDNHLNECAACKILVVELAEVNSSLRGVLAPIMLGAVAAPYLGASSAAAAGTAFGGVLAVLWSPFKAVGNWVRRLFQQLGTKGSIAAGTATAVVAGAIMVAMNQDEPEDEPEPPPAAQEPPDSPPAEEEDEPEEESPADDPPPPPADEPEEEDDPPEEEPDPKEPEPDPVPVAISHSLGESGLRAGGTNELPISLRGPEAGEEGATVSLAADFPEGITLADEETPEGWECAETEQGAECESPEDFDYLVTLMIDIPPTVTGYQTFVIETTGAVSGTEELRIAIAPQGSSALFATTEASGVDSIGNTWMSCRPFNCVEKTQNGHGDKWPMGAYRYRLGDPVAPFPLLGHSMSGAAMPLPEGAEIVRAELYWGSVEQAPQSVRLWDGSQWATVDATGIAQSQHGSQAHADVTHLVSPDREVWAASNRADLPSAKCGKCDLRWAGWGMTVIYRAPGEPDREIALYDIGSPADYELSLPAGETTVAYTVWGGSSYNHDLTWFVGEDARPSPCMSRARGALNGDGWYTFGVDTGRQEFTLDGSEDMRFHQAKPPVLLGMVAVASEPD
ncbi:sigma-70 family RNA polymerase sigma factor [Haloglycomyces albus]|uniref:sigma-70 family RNA polymerase sigma factor n=1 Tax=Haloglycomyces albus TaxID=526067 RepID=UPI00046D3F77|nr:sigma-70 family RNA polymerase sigma factor [Haloglycomyces albus]